MYEVLQCSDLAKSSEIIRQIAQFYDENWTGNKDFMHIPDIEQIAKNVGEYPIIIARKKENSDILAISTIKDEENNKDNINPYYPKQDQRYLSITGILTKHGSNYRGMGKKIYEIALRASQQYCIENDPELKVMCEIDCRNKQSLGALSRAVQSVNENSDTKIDAYIDGVYEVEGQRREIAEAPTFVIEIDLNNEKAQDNKPKHRRSGRKTMFKFTSMPGIKLNRRLDREIFAKLRENGIKSPVVGRDGNCTIKYFELKDKTRIGDINIDAGKTIQGNDRTPKGNFADFMGPFPSLDLADRGDTDGR